MSNSYNNSRVIVNPILATFPADEVNIQPYWLVVLSLFASQLWQRLWHLFKHRTCFTTLEIAGLLKIYQQRLSNYGSNGEWASSVSNSETNQNGVEHDRELVRKLRSIIVVDIFDAFSCLSTLGHTIWYCVIQSKCPNSSSIATPWNCYNALGYRLFNYIFVSYFTTTLDLGYKAYAIGLAEVLKTDAEKKSFSWYLHYATLIIIAFSLLFTGCLLLPFVLTHLIPMFVIYIWISIVYIGTIVYLTVSSFTFYKKSKELPAKVQKKDIKETTESDKQEFCSFMFSTKEMPQVALSMLLALVISTFPILLSILFNYSQFYYYGETYLKSIEADHLMRDTTNYFNLLRNSSQQIIHMILSILS